MLFDCDGVLVDSEPIANRILTEDLNSIGLAMSYREVCDAFVGLTLERCLELIAERLGRPAPADFLDRLQERTFAAFREDLRPVAGVREALERIDRPSCVASSGDPDKIRLSLELTGLLDRFQGRIFSARQVERGKPYPDLFLHAAATLGARPENCAVVEDSGPGIRAGLAAGMTVFAYVPEGHAAPPGTPPQSIFASMDRLPARIAAGKTGSGSET